MDKLRNSILRVGWDRSQKIELRKFRMIFGKFINFRTDAARIMV